MSKNTGGPAFPSGVVRKTRQRPNDPGSDFIISDTVEAKNPGLTLRDYFAAKAMQGQLCAQANPDLGIWKDFEALAEEAYRISDAMLKEREK